MRHPNLDVLLNKHIVLSEAKKAQLISELSLDDKRYLGNYLLDNEWFLETEKNPVKVEPDLRELTGEITFGGPTTYEDGVEVFVNNKE
jgi:hypothetical protein